MKSFLKFIVIALLSQLVMAFFSLMYTGNFEDLADKRLGIYSAVFFSVISFAHVYVLEKFLKNKRSILVKLVLTSGFVFFFIFTFDMFLEFVESGIVNLLLPFFVGLLGVCLFLLEYLIVNFYTNFDKRNVLLFTDSTFFYIKLLVGIILFETVLYSLMILDIIIDLTTFSVSFYFVWTTFLPFIIINVASFLSLKQLKSVHYFKKNIILVIFGAIFISVVVAGSFNFLLFTYNYGRFIFHLILVTFSTLLLFTIIDFRDKLNVSKKNVMVLSNNVLKKNTEYLQLKQQVDPHFLFNNLNVLISLIDLNPKKAIEFGHNLSNVYRHYLLNQSEDFVSLTSELQFIKEYLEIYKAKFSSGFSFEIQFIPADYYVLSLAVQELIENIFKHNVIVESNPIFIEIFVEDDFLVIKNSKNLKPDSSGTKIGLDNIKRRYELLNQKTVIVTNEISYFSVHLPFVKLID